jgi:DNA polymerase-3 subunit beta
LPYKTIYSRFASNALKQFAIKKHTCIMKFIVSSSTLLKHLQQISGVINANTVLPILEDFLFEIQDKKLSLVATDLETVMRVEMDVESKTNGKICIPARILIDSLKNISDQPLTFNIEKN